MLYDEYLLGIYLKNLPQISTSEIASLHPPTLQKTPFLETFLEERNRGDRASDPECGGEVQKELWIRRMGKISRIRIGFTELPCENRRK